MSVELLPGRPEDAATLAVFLRANNAVRVARRGVLVDPLDQRAVLARSGPDLLGVATYVVEAMTANCSRRTPRPN